MRHETMAARTTDQDAELPTIDDVPVMLRMVREMRNPQHPNPYPLPTDQREAFIRIVQDQILKLTTQEMERTTLRDPQDSQAKDGPADDAPEDQGAHASTCHART